MARKQSSGSGHAIAKAALVLVVLGALFTVVFSLGWSAGLEVGRGEAPNPTTSVSVESGEPGE